MFLLKVYSFTLHISKGIEIIPLEITQNYLWFHVHYLISLLLCSYTDTLHHYKDEHKRTMCKFAMKMNKIEKKKKEKKKWL